MSFQQQKLSITSTPYQIYVTPTQYLTGYIEADPNNTVIVNISIVRWDNTTIPIQLYPGAKLNFQSYNCMYVYIYSSSNTYVNINLNVNPFVSGTSQVYVENPPEPTYISPEPPVTVTLNPSVSISRNSKTYNVISLSESFSTTSTTDVLIDSRTFTTDPDIDVNVTNTSLQINMSVQSPGGTSCFFHVTLQSSQDPNYSSETTIGSGNTTSTSYTVVNICNTNFKFKPNTTYTLRWYGHVGASGYTFNVNQINYIVYPLAVGVAIYISPPQQVIPTTSTPLQTVTTTLTRATATTKSTAIRSSSQVSFSLSNPQSVTFNSPPTLTYTVTVSTTALSITEINTSFTLPTSTPSSVSSLVYVTSKNVTTVNSTLNVSSTSSVASVNLNQLFSLGTSTSGSITISYSYSLTINAQVTLQLVYLPYILTLPSGLLSGATSETTIIQYTNADVIKQRLMTIQASANVNTTVNLYINGTNVQSFNILTGNQSIDLGYQYMLNKNDTVKLTYIQSSAGQFSCNLDIEFIS